ncbi:MAG TPA: MFS transporter [Vicinamibacteria bacterium]|nr:MFS transporter [Vicinamibacteria bacterium]
MPDSAGSYRGVLRNPGFMRLWMAQLVSQFGDFVALMALFSLVAFRRGGDASQVSGILISFYVPFILVGPVAGAMVDRWDLKRTLVGSDLVRAVLAGALALATTLSQLYAAFLLLCTVSTFFMPAQMVAIRLLVRKEELLTANALNAQAMQINKVIGPAAAGVLVASVGERACFWIDAASFLLSAALVSTLPLRRERAEGRPISGLLAELNEGLAFLTRNAALVFVTVAMVGTVLATGIFDALIALYVRDRLAAPPQVFTSVVSLVGAGTLIGAGLVGWLGRMASRTTLIAFGIVALGMTMLPLAAFSRTSVTLATSLCMGLAVACVILPAQTLMQEEAPPELLGRVFAAINALILLAKLVSVIGAATAATWIGIGAMYYLVATMLLATGLAAYAYTRLRGTAAAAV